MDRPWLIIWIRLPWRPAQVRLNMPSMHQPQVADTAVGDQLLDVLLGVGAQRPVDDADGGQAGHQRQAQARLASGASGMPAARSRRRRP